MIKTSTGENMSKYSDLLQVIKSRVCQNNNFPQTLLADSHSYRARQVWYRIGQIFTLECILDEYRKHFSSDYYYLDNDKALHHLIFEIGLAPIFPYTFYHLTHYWFAAADIPVANDTPVHYADAIRCNVRRPPRGSLPLLTRRVSA